MTDETVTTPADEREPYDPQPGPAHIEGSELVAERVAAGLPVIFDMSFVHPAHGRIAFTGELPLASAMMRHRVAMDNRLDGLATEARIGTMLLAATLAGFDCGLLARPKLRETRTEVPNDAGGMKVELVPVYYDHDQEVDVDFLTVVWTRFSAWRGELASEDVVRAVGNASGVTPGNA